jgi:hypothetical protein
MNFAHDFKIRRMHCLRSVGETLPDFVVLVRVVPGDGERGSGCVLSTVGSAPTVC